MGIRRRLLERLPVGEFGRGVLTVALGTGSAQVIVIASSPLLTRLFPPADYGVFAVAGSFLSILLTVSTLRYEYAIPLPEDDVAAANLVALSLLINTVFSIVAGLVLWAAGPVLLEAFGAAILGRYAFIVALAQFGGGVATVLTSWAVRTKNFGALAAARLSQALSLVAVQLGLGLAGFGALGLLLGDAAGRIGGSGRLARDAWRHHAATFRQVSLPGMISVASRYRRFPLLSSGSGLLATLGLQAPLLLLAASYGTEAGGRYALAARICAVPLVLIANSVSQVFVAEAARLAREDPERLRGLFSRTTWSLARTGIGPALLGVLLAPIFAGPVFGGEWGEAGLYVAILIPSYFVEFVAGATGDLLYVLERQDLHLAREILRLALVGGAIPVAAALGLSELEAVICLGVAGLVNYLLYGLITWRALARYRPPASAAPVELA